MSVVKIFENGAWREFFTDPAIVASNDPTFSPGEVDYVFDTGETVDLTLPAVVRAGSLTPTYSITGLPTGLTATGARIQGSMSSLVDRQEIALTATYTDGKQATKKFTISAIGAVIPPPLLTVSNIRLGTVNYRSDGYIQDITIHWDLPTGGLDSSVIKLRPLVFVTESSADTRAIVPTSTSFTTISIPIDSSRAGDRIRVYVQSEDSNRVVIGTVGPVYFILP